MTNVTGYCHPQFDRVREALEQNIAAGVEVGASVYVSVDGEPVVDLWGGWKDREHSGTWDEDTIVNVFSGTKTIASLAVLILVERGQVELDAPVSKYWPEFAANGKDKATVRHLISHTVGIPAWEPPFSMDLAMDIPGATARLAAQAPWWEPGTRGSYHASSFGHLLGELVQRVTGKTIGRFIQEAIAGPLEADVYVGLPDALFPRVATVYPADELAPPAPPKVAADTPPDSLVIERELSARTRLGSFSGQKRDPLALFNSAEWRRTEFAGSTGHANARGLGRAMGVIANGGTSRGVTLLSEKTIAEIFKEQFAGVDSYYLKPIHWGTGYALAPREQKERGPLPFLRPGPRTAYWYGTGGSLSIADAERRVAIGYAMNQCRSGRGAQNGVYYDAIYDSLG